MTARTSLELSRWSPLARAIVRAGIVAWALVGLGLVASGAFAAMRPLRWVIVALGIGAIIGLVLEPVVSALERRGVPRPAGVPIVVLAVLLPAGALLYWLARVVVEQATELIEQAPELFENIQRTVEDTTSRVANSTLAEMLEPERWSDRATTVLEGAGQTAFGAAATAGAIVIAVLLGLVVAVYGLLSLPRLRQGLADSLPEHRREDVFEGLRIVGNGFGAFLRGQVLIAAIVGLASGLAAWALGLPSPVLIGVVVGILDLVPFFGPIVGTAIGMALALATSGIWLAVAVLVIFVVIQQLESNLLGPLILGKTVRLPALIVLVAVAAGAALAGLVGMVLAVPAVVVARDLWQRFRKPSIVAAGPSETASGELETPSS
jgi:predicted PurR-regulated permease PerM